MNTLETDVEVAADGSLKLLSPRPDWLKPGRAHMLLMVTGTTTAAPKAKREIPTASPEVIAQRLAAFEELRKLDPYRDLPDPVAWQREIRSDVALRGESKPCYWTPTSSLMPPIHPALISRFILQIPRPA